MGRSSRDSQPFPMAFIDSFRRDPHRHIVDPIIDREESMDGFDPQIAAIRTANTGLVRKLKGRHLQMIAIGGSIGKLEAVSSNYGWMLIG